MSTDQMLAALVLAEQYLRHPDVQAIPFALSASVVLERVRAAIRVAQIVDVTAHDEGRYDVLCQCGWGQLACPEPALPDYCPVCGYDFTPHREALEEA